MSYPWYVDTSKPIGVYGYIRVREMNPRAVRVVVGASQLINHYCETHNLDLRKIFTEVSDRPLTHPAWSDMSGELNRDQDAHGVVVVHWRQFATSAHYAHCMDENLSGRGLYMAKRNVVHYVIGGAPVWPPPRKARPRPRLRDCPRTQRTTRRVHHGMTNNGGYVGPKGHCCVCGTEAAPGYGAPASEHNNPATGESCEGVSLATNKPDGS